MDADVIVIGGGITGLGVARDAALRGLKVILLERNNLGSGTSGYFHQILHSGARYAVTDPEAAAECYSENQILKRVARDAVIDIGGLFLAFNEEEVRYADTLLLACKKAGIPTTELSPQEVLSKEPRINKSLLRAFSVPSAHISGSKTIEMHKKAAKELGVDIITNCEVTGFVIKNGKIEAVKTNNQIFEARFVINASGVWTSRIGKMIDIKIPVTGYKGSMIVFKEQFTNTFLNRCRLPSDGDLMLPTGSEYIVGTTSIKTSDIDSHDVEQWEIDKLLEEAEVMIPDISKAKIVRSYSGVRPIYTPSQKHIPDRSESRSFKVLDHKTDGVENLVSVVGGKFMLYRLMAEKTVDTICAKLGSDKKCETAEIELG